MRTIFAMLLIANCALVPALAEETDSHHPAGPPGDAKLILENGPIQVLRIRIAPHEKTPMHDVTPRVVVWLADARFVDSFPDGTTREEIRRAGDVEWVPARRHAGENVGETPMDLIAVALEPADPATGADPDPRGGHRDGACIDPRRTVQRPIGGILRGAERTGGTG